MRFILSNRGAHTPRNLANGAAGLPRISSRVSFARCRAFPFKIELGLYYQVFEFIARCWRRRKSSFAQPPVSLFRSEIERLPKTKLIDGKRMQNFFRRHLEENWWALEAAIKECWNSKPHPRAIPYIVAVNFQKNLAKPKTYLDRVLIERETANI